MELDKDFKEFIELLNEHKVKYLVIGGYAVNFQFSGNQRNKSR
jgi:2-hydroxy-3-keto-5-methylthiopentenyl-1-phosphate phosphatase